MRLPYGERIDPDQVREKLTTYALNFSHESGKHKARLFQAKLGITVDNQEVLISAICQAAATSELAQFTGSDQYGERYVMVFSVVTQAGRSNVLTAWIIRQGEVVPRLTSTYPLRS